jgi:glycosyltransferase involved in cell wall biosynthesis
MPSIALCMIVRDEEAMLADCISSARAAVTDIVVIDTGSDDATRRIAVDAGARVFDFAWCDDFAAARNEALRHARADWVLVLDADERLAPGSAERLRAATARARFDCGMLRLHDAVRVDAPFADVVSGRERQAEVQLVPRLLRRTDGLRYVDRIHENVGPWLRRRGMKVAGVDADIVHLGATKQVVDAKSKIDRNLRMLRARIEGDPSDLSAYGYLVHDLIRAGAIAEALETAERGWSQVDGASRASPASIHRLATARAYLSVGNARFAEARETMRIAQAIEGDNPDFAFLAAYANESEAMRSIEPSRSALLAAAREGYRACLRFEGRVFAQSFVFGASSWCGATRLGTVELFRADPAEALRAFDLALSKRPDDPAARLGRAEAMIALGDPAGALRRIEGLLGATSPDAWTLAAQAVRALGLLDDARLFARRAQALAGQGFVAPHRREQLRDVVASLTPCERDAVSQG